MTAPDFFVPANNIIVDIRRGLVTDIDTFANHDFHAGQIVRLLIPATSGMQQLNGYEGEIKIVGAHTFSVPVDSRGFDPFVPILHPRNHKWVAQVIPIAENALTLDCATVNNNNILPEIIGPIPINP